MLHEGRKQGCHEQNRSQTPRGLLFSWFPNAPDTGVTETGFLRLPKSLYLTALSKATDRLPKLTSLVVTAFREARNSFPSTKSLYFTICSALPKPNTQHNVVGSNVAHERPSRRAKPACEGPPRCVWIYHSEPEINSIFRP